MTAPQFTPGPWRTENDDAAYAPPCVVIMADDTIIAEVLADEIENEPDAEVVATARLIAAAPELYEALEALRRRIVRRKGMNTAVYTDEDLQDAEAALAKARGELSLNPEKRGL